ncbi:hypothetical protein AAV94_13135 [Lampropedia cohaerens]|uniref:DNA repair protein RecO n=1 Tax=Lampropedia cohaerens TaxID=1610491 RepID=A0A0U1PX39_9BURK|nr:DNA repair protein RecO [Lampropedia cohaerens]KKW66997.1 hypothetical protein AAV94_13135 [Lampropedia cohaerens]
MASAAPVPARRFRRASRHHAWVLHQYPYSESSLVVELFTRERGRVAVVARGAKKPTSNFRALLLPFQLLRVDYSYDDSEHGEIGAVRAVERLQGPASPRGEALLAGLYLNELLMRMLVRGDVQADVFDAFKATLFVLSNDPGEALETLLRAFELVMLRQLGLLPDLSVQTVDQTPLQPERRYALMPEVGLHAAMPGQRGLSGAQWQLLQQALLAPQPLAACMRALGEDAAALKPQLRSAFAHYLGGELATQRMMRGLRGL